MFCSKCGNEIKEGENFCSKCGTPINNEPINENTDKVQLKVDMKKYTKIVLIGIPVLVIALLGLSIFITSANRSSVDITKPSVKTKENQTNNTKNKDIYTDFDVSVSEMKQYIDAFDNNLKKQGSYKTLLTSKWISTKQSVAPYYPLTMKEYYSNGKGICIISIASDHNGNIIDMKFTGLGEELNSYGKAVNDDYTQLMVNMAFYLEKLTGDKELKEYLINKLSSEAANGGVLFNEYKKGIKFTCGKMSDGYFKLEFTLEKYAAN